MVTKCRQTRASSRDGLGDLASTATGGAADGAPLKAGDVDALKASARRAGVAGAEAPEVAEAVEADAGGFDWSEKAESVQMYSETSRNMPQSRQSLEALGELLARKASVAWEGDGCWRGGPRRIEAERCQLESSARYVWERRLYDGHMMPAGDARPEVSDECH